MSVNVIATEDAKALAKKLTKSLQSNVGHIETFSPGSFLKSKTAQSGNSVCVVFLTTLSWQEIKRLKRNDVKRLFSKPARSVVLWSCTESIKSAAIDLFTKTIDDWSAVGLYDASGEDWYNAEARIKYRMSGDGEVHIPGASKYIIKPDTVSQLSEYHVEPLIILFEPDHITDVDKIMVKVGGLLSEAKKIQPNVWSFSVSDFTPGDHEIQVFADDVDLGTNIIHVQDRFTMMRKEFGKLRHEDPEKFLAELLSLDQKEFDRDLDDFISGSSCIAVLEKLLKYGDQEGCEFPTFLHFCSKYGLESCVHWCKTNHPNFKQACLIVNKDGKKPEQLAVETHQNQLLIQALQTNDSEPENLKPITSPFRKNVSGRDSGCSSSHGSGESLVPNSAITNSSKTLERQPFSFGRTRHTYNTIDDDDVRGTGTYNRPWDTKTLLADRSAQALSVSSVSAGIDDGMEESVSTKKALKRANTTSCSSSVKL